MRTVVQDRTCKDVIAPRGEHRAPRRTLSRARASLEGGRQPDALELESMPNPCGVASLRRRH